METFNEAFTIASLAIQAILYEVACFPSPGLVSSISSGAHKDMDLYTFIDSSVSLIKPLVLCAEAGFSNDSPKRIFESIRLIGIKGEEEMFKKTSGINTHKGILFLLGLCSAAAAKTIYEKKAFGNIQKVIKEMTEGIVEKELYSIGEDLNNKKLTHGEKLFLKYNTEGIRGEAERGLPIIFDFSLDFYKACHDLKKNDRLVHTLMGIMQYSEDSNILYRHSKEILQEVQNKAKHIVAIGGMKSQQGIRAIKELDSEFCIRNISPGGSADLLAVTVFLHLIEEKMLEGFTC